MHRSRSPIVELRQYTLRSGQRDVLIDLFDREFIESQEEAGMAILGQFRDLDRPDRFVWLRGFDNMPARAQALADFYGGPIWKKHSAQANATMIDSDDVLLLRPVTPHSGFPCTVATRPAFGESATSPSFLLATIYYRDRPFDKAFADFFYRWVRPVLAVSGVTLLACLQTLHAENTFPALPVRTGENAFVWFARFPNLDQLGDHQTQLERSVRWQDQVRPALTALLTGAPQQLRLSPTARSLLA